jgi:hypothetical protein
MSSEGDGESNSDRADEDDYDDINIDDDVSIEGDGESNSERDDEHIEYIRPEINDNEEMSDDDDDNYADDNNDDEIIRNYVAEMYSEGEYEYESDEDILSEVDDESIEEDMMRDRMRWRVQVQANDPGLIKLEIDQADFFFGQTAFEAFGTDIGNNSCLRNVTLKLHPRRVGLQFYRELAENRSIETLSLGGCSVEDDGILYSLIPFFKNNQAFKCLRAEFRSPNWRKASLQPLAYTLGQFNTLKEFELKCNFYRWWSDRDEAKDVFDALTGHVSLEKIGLLGIVLGRKSCVSLAELLQRPRVNPIAISLIRTTIDDAGVNILSAGFGTNTLTALDVIENVNITAVGWQSIFDNLKGPTCRLEKLDLSDNFINDAVVHCIANALRNNSYLKTLSLIWLKRNCHDENHRKRGRITVVGWRDLFSGLLQSPNSTLESLDLSGNSYNDDEIQCLSTALASNSRLRELQLSCNRDVTATGWEALATVLRNPNSALERLDLNSNKIDDRTILSFTNALAVNNKLSQLSLRDEDDYGATSAGWQSFSNVLQAPTSVLEQLDLSDNRIDDNVLATLANALANNTMLKEMKLCNLQYVTITGWQTFTTVLRSNTLALEKLDLSGNAMPNRLLSFVAEALANNNTLIELKFGAFDERSSTIDYSAFTLILCNSASIISTYNSNHTLASLIHEYNELKPPVLISLLKINSENSKSQAAGLKIFKTHFVRRNINLQPFMDMESSILPVAIAWLTKYEYLNCKGFSLLYRLIRAMPSLLED